MPADASSTPESFYDTVFGDGRAIHQTGDDAAQSVPDQHVAARRAESPVDFADSAPFTASYREHSASDDASVAGPGSASSRPSWQPGAHSQHDHDQPPANAIIDAEVIADDEPDRDFQGSFDDQSTATAATEQTWQQPGNQRADKQEREDPDLLAQLGGIASDIGSIASKSFRKLFAPAERPEPAQTQHSRPNQPAIDRVRIRAVGCRVEIVGDPSVATIAADGPHRLRHAGDVLEVIAEGRNVSMLNAINLSSINPFAPRGEQWRFAGPSLILRVNPGVIVDADVTGGGLMSRHLPRFGNVRTQVAGLQLKDVEQIQDGSINAGNAVISGSLSDGRSRLSVGGGNLSIRLFSTANVTIRSLNSMGRISWPDPELQGLNEYVVGSGAGRLDIDVVVGRAKIVVLPPGAA